MVGGRIVGGLRRRESEDLTALGHVRKRSESDVSSDQIFLSFLLKKHAVFKAEFITYLFWLFLRNFHAKMDREQTRTGEVRKTHRSTSFPIRSWLLTTYKCPSQLSVANHGRRYVFSQPILDHICIGNASHLEHSRPGANGRRVTPAVDTTTWHSETTSLPQSRSSIAQTRKKSLLQRYPVVSPTSPNRHGLRYRRLVSLLSTNSALRHSHPHSTSTSVLNFLVASRLSTFHHLFPPSLHLAQLTSLNPT